MWAAACERLPLRWCPGSSRRDAMLWKAAPAYKIAAPVSLMARKAVTAAGRFFGSWETRTTAAPEECSTATRSEAAGVWAPRLRQSNWWCRSRTVKGTAARLGDRLG